ncbi:MAG: heavy-metal-associated domain-containing protein [Cyanobacteria bacterium P01_E01_bin.34]
MTATFEFTVPKLACQVCVGKVTKALQELDNSATVAADPSTKLVTVTSDLPEPNLREALTAAGYPPN